MKWSHRDLAVILTSTHDEQDFADLVAASPARGFLPKLTLSADAIRGTGTSDPARPAVSSDSITFSTIPTFMRQRPRSATGVVTPGSAACDEASRAALPPLRPG